MELLSHASFGWALFALYLLSPLAILGWCVVRFLSGRRSWIVAFSCVFGWLVLVAGFTLFWKAGAQLNLMTHQSTYDAIVAEARAGQLRTSSSSVFHENERNGARYIVNFDGPGTIAFPWDHDPHGGFLGVVYDTANCPEATTESPQSARRQHEGDENLGPQMKRAGSLGRRHRLKGHYCFLYYVF